jgi:hypothetical protein
MAFQDAWYIILVFYLSASNDFEEEACDNGAEALSNPL